MAKKDKTTQHDQQRKQGNWFARHKFLTVVLAIIVIAIFSSALGGGDKDKNKNAAAGKSDTAASASGNPASTPPAMAKVGEAARDGKFEFNVQSVKCGVPSVSDSTGYISKSAQGQYCLMTVSVKNIGDKQQIFSESDQKLLNTGGQQYSPDTTATLYNSNNSDAFVNEINPGNTAQGVIVFDIPKDQAPVTAELHDSSLSGGVKVSLQ